MLRLARILASYTNGAFVVVLWPGDSAQLNFASYPLEGRDADDTAAELVRFADRVVRPGAELSFIAHSLGARVALESANRLYSRPYLVRQICLMAAAVDDFSLAAPPVYRSVTLHADRVVVLASEQDQVLRYAYPAGDFLESFLFADQIAGQALGLRGPKSYSGQAVPARALHIQIPELREVNHGDYLPSNPATTKQQAAIDVVGKALQGIETLAYP